MPVQIKKMNMVIGNIRRPLQKGAAPTQSAGLHAPMVGRISGVKSGCGCGK